MPLNLQNIQWLNQNASRSYPLTDDASKTDTTGTITVPDSFIVSLYMPVHAGIDVEPDKFFLHTLAIYPTGYNIAIGYDDGSASPPIIASVNIPRSTHTENRSYALPGVDEFDDMVGKIAIGRLTEIDLLPPGIFRFTPSSGAIEADAIRPEIRGVVSLTCVNGTDRSVPLYGHIEFVSGTNMRIVANTFLDRDPQIVFSAISGEGLNEQCICEEEDEGPCIATINGISPLPNGDFRMTGDDCLVITPISHGLKLTDDCSQPCCGCTELQALTRQIDRFADGVLTFQNFVSQLGSVVTQMSSVVLGSRLGDQGCVEC